MDNTPSNAGTKQLGALPAASPARLAEVTVRQWGEGLARTWHDGDWLAAPARVGARIAALIGASPDEVIAADTVSINIYKLLAAVLDAQPQRRVILTEVGNFPTDLYIAQGLVAHRPGVSLRIIPAETIAAEADAASIVLLSHVDYRSGACHDLPGLTAALHAKGAAVVWDLSHSVGAVEIDLAAAGAQLAVGCGYKYLNGGPGAPAFLYVARGLQPALRSPLAGWMGHAAPFDFPENYAPAAGIARFLCGTPPILGLTALEVGVAISAEAGMATIARKSQALCETFIALVEQRCAGAGHNHTPDGGGAGQPYQPAPPRRRAAAKGPADARRDLRFPLPQCAALRLRAALQQLCRCVARGGGAANRADGTRLVD